MLLREITYYCLSAEGRMGWEEITFTTLQAERLSGVSVFQQRNYRRHHNLFKKANALWARYSVQQVATLLVMGKLSAVGITPSASSVIAKNAGALIRRFALKQSNSLHGQHRPMSDKSTEKRFLLAVPNERNALRYRFEEDLTIPFAGPGDAVALILDLQALGIFIATKANQPLMRGVDATSTSLRKPPRSWRVV